MGFFEKYWIYFLAFLGILDLALTVLYGLSSVIKEEPTAEIFMNLGFIYLQIGIIAIIVSWMLKKHLES